MNTADYVAGKLAGLGLPVAYRHQKDAVAPYCTYYVGTTRIVPSDNGSNAFSRADDVTIELHTVEKSAELEDAITMAIAADGWDLSITEGYDYYEAVYEVTFNFTRTWKQKIT